MLVSGRLVLCLILILDSTLLINIKGDFVDTKERKKRQIFPLLGYLQGYKIGQSLALQIPPFVLSPVIILPSVNQQQSVNIKKSGTDDSFQENGGTFQIIMPVKLSPNCSLKDPETRFRSSSESNIMLQSEIHMLNDTLRQINEVSTSSTEISDGGLLPTTNFQTDETDETTTLKPITTIATKDFYPTPVYNNEMINFLQLTTPSSDTYLELPSLEDKWKNFTSIMKQPENITDTIENTKNELQESASVRLGSYQLTEKYYPRPNTRYYNPYPYWYNAMVDQFPITTNSYREEEKESPLPPRYDDRWRRFSSLSKVVSPASGFKPLAGLYYDGFLHKSLTKKTGFIPFDKLYYY